eukprot:TRINITY_DN8764_c0_g1_i4.p1 TRINITY_DN8764_c0_g1~~TRINITY_DN8764_c0_g1_i4.p1  ORF type:complete len:146 (+),score=21.95 TRINITY_DN8764_c0_g1_i4:158-595(+)
MKNPDPPGPWTFLVNSFIALSCLIPQLFNFKPEVLITFDGAVCGFILIYIIPISLHLQVLYGDDKKLRSSDFRSREDVIEGHPDSSVVLESLLRSKLISEEQLIIDSLYDSKKKIPKIVRLAIYGIMTLIGFLIVVLQVYSLITG